MVRTEVRSASCLFMRVEVQGPTLEFHITIVLRGVGSSSSNVDEKGKHGVGFAPGKKKALILRL